MTVGRALLAIGFALLVASACSRPSTPVSEPVPAETARVATSPEAPVASVASAKPPADAAVVDAAVRATLPAAAKCETDADCGWDDPCAPKACGAKSEPPPGQRCGRPSTPGQCRCASGVCALVKPEAARNAARVSCQADTDCAFDAASGACANGTAADPSALGIICVCDTLNHWCVQSHRGDVPCKSFKDCSWQYVNGKTSVPVPVWFSPRSKPTPVRPCKDGEVDSVCRDGVCRIEAWRC